MPLSAARVRACTLIPKRRKTATHPYGLASRSSAEDLRHEEVEEHREHRASRERYDPGDEDFPHDTEVYRGDAAGKPYSITAPTMVWVVEMGSPVPDAITTVVAVAS